MTEEANQKITIPMPVVAPFGTEVDADAVQMVWDTYIKPGQEAEMPQSIRGAHPYGDLAGDICGAGCMTDQVRPRHPQPCGEAS